MEVMDMDTLWIQILISLMVITLTRYMIFLSRSGYLSMLIQALGQVRSKEDSTEELDDMVAKALSEKRVAAVRVLSRGGLHVMAIWTFGNLTLYMMERKWASLAHSSHISQGMFRTLCALLAFLLISECPWIFSYRTLPVVNVLLGFTCVRIIIQSQTASGLVNSLSLITSLRVIECIVIGWTFPTVFVDLAIGVFSCVSYACRIAEIADSDVPMDYINFVASQVGVAFVGAVLANTRDQLIAKEAKANFQSDVSTRSKATVESLLTGLCDAVIHLDESLRIRSSAEKLSAILLSGQNLKDCPFSQLMSAAEFQRFEAHMRNSEQQGHAQSLNVNFNGSSSTGVPLRLLSAPIISLSGNVGYIIGISEIAESGTPDAFHHYAWAPNNSAHKIPRSHRSLSSRGSEGSGRSACVKLSTHLPKGSPADPVTVSFDAMSVDLMIIDASNAFSGLCGVHPGNTSLLQWIHNTADFFAWVQDKVNCFTYDIKSCQPTLQNIVLRRYEISSGDVYDVRATCSISFSYGEDSYAVGGSVSDIASSQAPEDMLTGSLHLTNLRSRPILRRNGMEIDPPEAAKQE